MGVATTEPPGAVATPTRPPRRARVGFAVAVGLDAAAVGFGVFAHTVLRNAPSALPRLEADLAAAAYAPHQLNPHGLLEAWTYGTFTWQLHGYASLTDAFHRYRDLLPAGREAMLAAAGVSVALVWLLARQLHLSAPASAGATLIVGVAPLAVTLHDGVHPGNLAAMWLLLAAVFVPVRRLRPVMVALSVLGVDAAVLTAPAAGLLVLALGLGLVLAGDIGPHWGWPRRGAALVVVSAVGVVGYLLLARAHPVGLPEPSVSVLLGLDPPLVTLAGVAAVCGLVVRAARPLVVGLVVLAVLAATGVATVTAVILAIPIVALVVATVADQSAAWWLSRQGRTRQRPAVPLLVGGCLAAVLLAGWIPRLMARARAVWDSPVPAAAAWATSSLSSRPALLVDGPTWAELVHDRYPASRLVRYAPNPSGPPTTPAYAFVLAPAAGPPTGSTAAAVTAWDQGLSAARFGGREAQIVARQVVPGSRVAALVQLAKQQHDRRTAGVDLASNPRLALTPGAAGDLRRGVVDGRLLALLAVLGSEHRLTLADFPVVAGEEGLRIARRTVVITAIDGQPANADGSAVAVVSAWLLHQNPPYRPDSVTVRGAPPSLRVQFDPQPLA